MRRTGFDAHGDLTIRGMGWMPVRFWVYELRERMSDCVHKVEALLKQTQPVPPRQ
jgi:very-short-patch-repair endonuclease